MRIFTEDEKRQKLEYLRQQKANPTGNYRQYLVNLYHYFQKCGEDNGGLTSIKDMVDATYVINPSEEMKYEKTLEYKNTLASLGYIKNTNENGVWITRVIKDLDF